VCRCSVGCCGAFWYRMDWRPAGRFCGETLSRRRWPLPCTCEGIKKEKSRTCQQRRPQQLRFRLISICLKLIVASDRTAQQTPRRYGRPIFASHRAVGAVDDLLDSDRYSRYRPECPPFATPQNTKSPACWTPYWAAT
jgi:hypothetical protein